MKAKILLKAGRGWGHVLLVEEADPQVAEPVIHRGEQLWGLQKQV